MFFAVTPVMFYGASVFVDTNEIVVEAEEEPAISEYAPQIDVCGLEVVTCEEEIKPVDIAIETIPHETQETENRIKYLFDKAGDILAPTMAKTIWCESMWFSIKSVLPEESYGLAQIHLPSHPHISKEQALNAYFAIDFMIEHWDADIWFGYDRETDSCTNGLPHYW